MTGGSGVPWARRRRGRWIATAVGGVLATSGVVILGVALSGQEPAPPHAPSAADRGSDVHRSDTAPPHADLRTGPHDSGMDFSRPTQLSIPSLHVTSDLEDLGLDDRGVMETPTDPSRAGWFTPSPAPGVPGASVIAGHVTWGQEPAVFFRLGELRRGDRIEVERADGSTAAFEVRRVGTFLKRSFPTDAVYGQVGHPSLRLITCSGTYDDETNSYPENLIVWATLV
jgi:LPXTG-site transpeptidase (sortase) family protein